VLESGDNVGYLTRFIFYKEKSSLVLQDLMVFGMSHSEFFSFSVKRQALLKTKICFLIFLP